MERDALQTFKNTSIRTQKNLGDILASFRKKYIKQKLLATAKDKFQKLVFKSSNHKLVKFLEEVRRLGSDTFKLVEHAIIEQIIYAKRPPHLKKLIDQAHLENSTIERIVTLVDRELGLSGLEDPDELQKCDTQNKTKFLPAETHFVN